MRRTGGIGRYLRPGRITVFGAPDDRRDTAARLRTELVRYLDGDGALGPVPPGILDDLAELRRSQRADCQR